MTKRESPPIKDEDGELDHRGRYWPVDGCECTPCMLAKASRAATVTCIEYLQEWITTCRERGVTWIGLVAYLPDEKAVGHGLAGDPAGLEEGLRGLRVLYQLVLDEKRKRVGENLIVEGPIGEKEDNRHPRQ